MSKSNAAVVLDEDIVTTAPVHIKVPQSAARGRGKAEQVFITRTAYVTFRIPTEDELEEVEERVRRDNVDALKRQEEAQKKLDAAATDEEREAAEREIAQIRKSYRLIQTEELKAVIVDLPPDSGIVEKDGTAAGYSPDVIERLCGYRHIRSALWDAFVLLLNGGAKRGNS